MPKHVPLIDPQVLTTHAALFDLWFPLADLPIPPDVKVQVAPIADQVSTGMLLKFGESESFIGLLAAMTDPKLLPFYDCLGSSSDPAVKAFLAAKGGFGGMPAELRSPLFSFLFKGSCGPASVQVAMVLREAYLSGIWDLPLAVPLTGILPPSVFMPDVEIYSALHRPELPPSRLYYDANQKCIRHRNGPIDCVVVGSGPGGATVAHQLWKAGKRVVVVESGPWVVWGSMDTRSYPELMFQRDVAATADNGVILRSAQTVGGGSTVNIDLAFSPLEATIQARVGAWKEKGLIDARFYTQADLAAAYQWVRETIATRQLSQTELNQDNRVLWDGAERLGVDPRLYRLNRYRVGYSPSPVDDKRDAAKQLLLPAAESVDNPLSIIPDASAMEVLFEPQQGSVELRATGVTLTMNEPWTEKGNTIVDPSHLGVPVGATVTIPADMIVLAAGSIGTTRILLNTAKTTPAVNNPRIGKGLILHPSLPIVGAFDRQINLLEGLDSATFVDAFGVTPGFIFETMGGLPSYGAVLVPGSGRQVYDVLSKFSLSAGFGVMLVDTVSDGNRVSLDEAGNLQVIYALSEADKQRFQIGAALAIRTMFLAGAKTVIIPSNENFLRAPNFDPMRGMFLTDIKQADLVERNLEFIPNRTVLTAAHLQATTRSARRLTSASSRPGSGFGTC